MMRKQKKSRFWLCLALVLLGLFTGCSAAALPEETGRPASVQSAVAENEGREETIEKVADGQDAVPENARQEETTREVAENARQEETTQEVAENARQEEVTQAVAENTHQAESALAVTEDGFYTGKDEVALYLHEFGHLPDNYITKKEARALGWDSSKGNLWDVAPDKSIGGDHFGNYEWLLPEEDDRDYFECDIDYEGGRRNAKRIIYSDDGLIFYTEDHYASFEQLY